MGVSAESRRRVREASRALYVTFGPSSSRAPPHPPTAVRIAKPSFRCRWRAVWAGAPAWSEHAGAPTARTVRSEL